MRKLQLRRLAIFLLIVTGIGAGVLIVHAFQVRRSASHLLVKARESKEARSYDEAIGFYGKYLSYVPDDLDAKEEFGHCLADVFLRSDGSNTAAAYGRRAYDTLERVLHKDQGRIEARRQLVQVALRISRPNDARQHLESFLLNDERLRNDGEIHELLGRCQEAQEAYNDARASYEKAVELSPERLDSYALLANLLGKRLKTADGKLRKEEADKCMNAMVEKNPKIGAAYLMRGKYRLLVADDEALEAAKVGTPEEAKKQLLANAERLLAAARKDADSAFTLLKKNPDDEKLKEEDADRAVANARRVRQQAVACLLAAQCVRKLSGLPSATSGVEKAEQDRRKKLLLEARDLSKLSRDTDPTYANAYVMLAEIEALQGKASEATEVLRSGLYVIPDSREILWALATRLVESGKSEELDEAEKSVERLQSLGSEPALVGYLQGRIEFGRGQWLQCARTLEAVRGLLRDWPPLVRQAGVLIAACHARLGDWDRALTALSGIKDAGPQDLQILLAKVQAQMNLGQINEAIEDLRQIVKLQGVPATVFLDLAKLLILRNLRTSGERKWDEAKQVLAEAAKRLPDQVGVPILEAEMHIAQGQPAEAEKTLLDARAKFPKEITLWVALAALKEREQKWDAVEQYLREAEQKFGDVVAVRLAKARYLVARYGKEAAPRLGELAKQSDAFQGKDAEYQELALNMAVYMFRADDFEHARELCRLVADKQPANLQVRLFLFDLASQSNDDAAMQQSLQEIGKIEENGAIWHYASAVHLHQLAEKLAETDKNAAAFSLSSALQHITQAQSIRPKWSRPALLAGQIHERQNNSDAAIDDYRKAIDLGESSLTAIKGAVNLLYQKQRYSEANRVLDRLGDAQDSVSSDLAKIAMAVSLQVDDFNRAREVASRAAKESKNAADHIWFAQLLTQVGQRAQTSGTSEQSIQIFQQAEREYREGIRIAPSEPQGWVALVDHFERTGQQKQAMATIEEAQKKIRPQQAPVAIAKCYDIIGQTDEAEKRFRDALQAAPNDPVVLRAVIEYDTDQGKLLEAEPLLKRLLSGSVQAQAGDLRWARRKLALVLLQSAPSYSRLEQARTLIEQNTAGDEIEIQDLRAKAYILGSHPKVEWREEAKKIWERQLDQAQSLEAEDRFALAKVNASLGKWSEASRNLRDVVATSGMEPRYICAYLRALIEKDEYAQAEQWLDRCVSSLLSNAKRDDLKPQELAKQLLEVAESAMDLRERILEANARNSTGQQGQRGSASAAQTNADSAKALAARLAQAAEALLKEYVRLQPQNELALARFRARQGQFDEAFFALVEKAWPKESPEMLASVLSAALSAKPSAEQRQRIDKILASALEKHQRPVSLLLILAAYHEAAGEFDRGESAYRAVLKKDPDNSMALNNLAALLAAQGKNLDEARQLIDHAIEIAGPLPSLLDTRATVFLAKGEPADIEAAEADLRQVESQGGDEARAVAYFHQAMIYYRKERAEDAAQAFRNAEMYRLSPEKLHPLERSSYDELKKELGSPAS